MIPYAKAWNRISESAKRISTDDVGSVFHPAGEKERKETGRRRYRLVSQVLNNEKAGQEVMPKGTVYALESSCDGGGRVEGTAEATGWEVASVQSLFVRDFNELGEPEIGKKDWISYRMIWTDRNQTWPTICSTCRPV